MFEDDFFAVHMELSPDVDTYLFRIGLRERPSVTLHGLNELILAHQCHVPFENIGICDHGYHVSLKINDLYKKIVVENKGGYCFENNASFGSLLNSLGFIVRPCACRMTRPDGSLTRIIHRANIVTIGGREYLCDVSSGGTEAPVAIEIKEGSVTTCGKEKFYFIRYDENWWEFHCVSPYLDIDEPISEPRDSIAILVCTSKVLPEDFYAVSDYCCTDPDSPFVLGRRVFIRNKNGFTKLNKNILTIVEGEDAIVKVIPEDDIKVVLEENFGLIY